jgi:hypothetical protein
MASTASVTKEQRASLQYQIDYVSRLRDQTQKDHVERGVWNVMDDLHADHGFFSGGYMLKSDPHPFFRDLLDLLRTLG